MMSGETMACPRCKKQNPSWYAACENCGANLSLVSQDSPQIKKTSKKDASNSQKLPVHAYILCGWHLLIALGGGLWGGAVGGGAFAINLAIYRSKIPGILKVILNLLISLLALYSIGFL